jgi:SAM-dependent methyltransferase
MSAKWYQKWFDSPFYHILYHQRNDAEAEYFIDNLCQYLHPTTEARMLDIACGKGRHSVYLNKKGFDVTGIDLSYSSIKYARQFENEKLHFFEHDMRKLLYINYFDVAFNLFTSFGYFESEKDNVNTLKAFRKSIKKDGTLVLDYFNSAKIVRNLTETETKSIDGIDFHIQKKVVNGYILKTIEFKQGRKYKFKEEVQAYSYTDFERLFKLSGFKINACFGSYKLEAFDPEQSDRLIFICSKADA